jgi:hypothetical protein
MGEYFAEAAVRADTAVRPYAEDLDRLASFVMHPSTKKNDACLASSFRVYQSVIQQLMYSDYQIGLDSASGVCLGCAGRMKNRAHYPIRTGHLHCLRHLFLHK